MLYDVSRNAITFRTSWRSASDEELTQAMDALDATLTKSDGGLQTRYAGAFCGEHMPHAEYYRRSVMNTFFNTVRK